VLAPGRWTQGQRNSHRDSFLASSAASEGRSLFTANKSGGTTGAAAAFTGTFPSFDPHQDEDDDEGGDSDILLVEEEKDREEDRRLGGHAGGNGNLAALGDDATTRPSPSPFGAGNMYDQEGDSGGCEDPSEQLLERSAVMVAQMEMMRDDLEKMRTDNAILLESLAVAGDAIASAAAALDDDDDGAIIIEGAPYE
jgi:hypothetical protein